jgi:hypothetical protein
MRFSAGRQSEEFVIQFFLAAGKTCVGVEIFTVSGGLKTFSDATILAKRRPGVYNTQTVRGVAQTG